MGVSYLSPYSKITIGDIMAKNSLAAMDVWLSRKSEADVLDFYFLPEITGIELPVDTPVQLELGYSGQPWQVFDGYITAPGANGARAKDEMVKLFRTTITQSFVDTMPQEVIGYGLRAAGISNFELSARKFETKPRLVVANKNVAETISLVNQTWGIDFDRYFDINKTFLWKELNLPASTELYSFEYGENIISMSYDPDKNAGSVITVLAPFANHSQEILIEHPDVPTNTRFVTDTIRHYLDGKAYRTQIFFSIYGGGQ